MTDETTGAAPEPPSLGVIAVADVEPIDADGVGTVAVGTALWLVAFVAMLPFYGSLAEAGRVWWLWTCLAGFGLGLFGLEFCRRRRRARADR